MPPNASYAGQLNLPQSPTVQIPGQRYDYEFGVSSPATDKWASPAMDANELKFFPSDTQQQQQSQPQSAFGHGHSRSFSGPLTGLDTSSPYISGLDGNDFGAGMYDGFSPATATAAAAGGTGTTPPSAGFAAPGLPFHGLDYIRNYNPTSGGAGVGPSSATFAADQEQYWQSSFDTFGVDPEMSFNFGNDFTTDGQWPSGGQ